VCIITICLGFEKSNLGVDHQCQPRDIGDGLEFTQEMSQRHGASRTNSRNRKVYIMSADELGHIFGEPIFN
jgi:hypothetical protein